jgi:hypothetical protein
MMQPIEVEWLHLRPFLVAKAQPHRLKVAFKFQPAVGAKQPWMAMQTVPSIQLMHSQIHALLSFFI